MEESKFCQGNSQVFLQRLREIARGWQLKSYMGLKPNHSRLLKAELKIERLQGEF